MVISSVGKLLSEGVNMKNIHFENAGENTNLYSACATDFGGICFEIMSPRTLQKSGMVEQVFATLYSHI